MQSASLVHQAKIASEPSWSGGTKSSREIEVLDELYFLPLREFSEKFWALYHCKEAGIKNIGELFELGAKSRLQIQGYSKHTEAEFQKFISTYTQKRQALLDLALKARPLPPESRHEGKPTLAQVCAGLYFFKKLEAIPPIVRDWTRGRSDSAVRAWLHDVDLGELLQEIGIDIGTISQPATNKEHLLKQCPEHERLKIETELYRVARTLISPFDWSPSHRLKFVPSWVLSREIRSFEVDGHFWSACKAHGFRTYREILSKDILRLRGIGRKSEKWLYQQLDEQVFFYFPLETSVIDRIKQTLFLENLRSSLNALAIDPRNIEIFRSRLALGKEGSEEPVDLAERFRLSRNSIHQIEHKTWQKIFLKNRHWQEVFTRTIEHVMARHHGKISLETIEQIEPWLGGISTQVPAFKSAIHHAWRPKKSPYRVVVQDGSPMLLGEEESSRSIAVVPEGQRR